MGTRQEDPFVVIWHGSLTGPWGKGSLLVGVVASQRNVDWDRLPDVSATGTLRRQLTQPKRPKQALTVCPWRSARRVPAPAAVPTP